MKQMRCNLSFLIVLVLCIPALAFGQNSSPVEDAGPDQTIFLGDDAALHRSATDVDRQPVAVWLRSVDSAPEGCTPEIFYPYMKASEASTTWECRHIKLEWLAAEVFWQKNTGNKPCEMSISPGRLGLMFTLG